MDENKISQICIIITLIGLILFLLYQEEEFETKTIQELITTTNISKAKVFGKIDYVIKNYPTTQFILNDGTGKITIYYPKKTDLEKNNFIYAYIEKEDEKNSYAYKVVKEE